MAEITAPIYSVPSAIAEALAAGNVEQLLRLQRDRFFGSRMEGEGGDGGDGGDEGGQGGSGDEGGDGKQRRGPGSDGNKPISEMNDTEKAEYFSKKADRLAKSLKDLGVTTEELATLRDKANKHDELEMELMSDRDKAVVTAKGEGSKETSDKLLPQLIRAEFRAEFKGRVADDQLDAKVEAILEPLDVKKFLTSSGDDVDTDKVRAFVENIQPAKGVTFRRGPDATAHGGGGGGSQGRRGEAGLVEAEKRFGKKSA